MDELLALMDDNVPAEETENSSSAAGNVSGRHYDRNDESIVAAHAASAASATIRRAHPDLNHSHSNSNEPQGRVEISIDNKLGIRMMKLKMSSIDLMDFVSSHPYHSTASIAAMSLASLNRLLIEPTLMVSAATVSGKTNIVTVGIVFTNSGTRISGNGRAFSVLSIGNLETGPVVSVFLFGEAYSKHCAKCPPGTVIALVTPNLLPPKEDASSRGDTTVSLSVSDPRQFIPLALARDYAICKATVSTKRSDGQWISNGGRCKHHVDLRISAYCEKHRKQENTKSGPVQKKKTFIEKQRMERDKGVMTMQMPGVGVVVTHKQPPIDEELQEQMSRRFTNAPMHMKKHTPPVLPSQQSRFTGKTSSRQPMMQGKNTRALVSRPATQQASSSRAKVESTPVIEDWLDVTKMERKKRTLLTGKKRAINKDIAGYDGSVAIPKPNKMFRDKAAPLPQRNTATYHQKLTASKADSIRQQQRLLVDRHKENTLSQGLISGKPVTKRGSSKPSSDDALEDSLFGQFDSMDTEQLLNAKSQFSDEADAEAYAKSRHAVTELERREEQKMQSEKKQLGSKESAIEIEFVCQTCNKTSKVWPKFCARAKHKVKRVMNIKKSDTVQERRLKLDEKSVEDGGLKLGAGLEWDRRRF